ncbi:hypothetical protein EXN65_15980 [Clostridium botulinum]|uniref:Uncharacterized protein n=1 Tax=Clostridium botulinum (strain 657 / Type Ba4) TaxID=515621 RepID=A0A3F2ZSN2_CLOB6|nr:hypothetical protein [Clostridium botulinum]ACQ53428.1 hypothetical protein CLJ_B2553 [Clostridium botulinum Ba4 str. 657]AXG90514.1 hypothetical protein AGE29_01465 [Clostridium botulinum]MBY6756987.1 hypothetical protein [Clostridium botulinum]MBY6758675.1 hypothetical protein [Clostridium botulinum]NEZ85874.1 hypothetical protein [Clostridium botulinum]
MKVEYVGDKTLGLNNKVHTYLLFKCPSCDKYPTYNMNPCPYCGEYLEYPEVEESE